MRWPLIILYPWLLLLCFFHKFSRFVARKAILDRICLAIDINRKMVLHSEMAWSNVRTFPKQFCWTLNSFRRWPHVHIIVCLPNYLKGQSSSLLISFRNPIPMDGRTDYGWSRGLPILLLLILINMLSSSSSILFACAAPWRQLTGEERCNKASLRCQKFW